MIVSRTPYRVSLFGGGSDYPSWNSISNRPGSVIGFTINKYSYISLRYLPPYFYNKYRIAYSKVETTKTPHSINHPAVRNIILDLKIKQGLEIHHHGDLPARTGIGSSSSFTVGLLKALKTLQKKDINKKSLAKLAIHIEQNVIKENVGSQDQIWASYGGLNKIHFHKNNKFNVSKVQINPKRLGELENNLVLIYTGIARNSDNQSKKIIKNLKSNKDYINTMIDYVNEAENIFINPKKNFDELGELLGEYWKLKKRLSNSITLDRVDRIYKKALNSGAIGGKLLGAGGGGFLLLYVNKKNKEKLLNKLNKLITINFKIDSTGSTILDKNI